MELPPGYVPADGSLRDRVVLVTGAAGGLGRAAALACAAAGATVVLLGRRVRPLEKLYDAVAALPGSAQPAVYPMDLGGATPEDYSQLATSIERECGRLDGVLHAAAHFAGLLPFGQEAPDEWARSLHVNLVAPLALTRACLPLLARSDAARVVFVLDDPGRVQRAYWGPYAAAKAGLGGLVAALSDELENSSIAVCGMLPGPMRTALRARAYFAENPAAVAPADAFAPACVYLLGPAGARYKGAILDARGLTAH